MKILCIGRNYAEHARELNNPVPERPVVFMKPPSALLPNNKPLYYPEFTRDLHYEVEVVLKIIKNGKYIQPEFAADYYDHIGLGIDFTARDLQAECKKNGHPWEIAKGFDGSAVMSPLVPLRDLPREDIVFSLEKNGEVVQKGNTRDMIFSFDEIIVYLSQFFRLQIGDLIFTGTPQGVGPVKIGDNLKGLLHYPDSSKEMFTCSIK